MLKKLFRKKLKNKMRKILIIALSILLLSACTLTEKCEECKCSESENPKIDIFERNKECYEYKDDVELENGINHLNEEASPGRISSIFYSPKLNTCLYVYSRGLLENTFFFQSLNDVFTGENIDTAFGDLATDEGKKDFDEFQALVKSYQQK